MDWIKWRLPFDNVTFRLCSEGLHGTTTETVSPLVRKQNPKQKVNGLGTIWQSTCHLFQISMTSLTLFDVWVSGQQACGCSLRWNWDRKILPAVHQVLARRLAMCMLSQLSTTQRGHTVCRHGSSTEERRSFLSRLGSGASLTWRWTRPNTLRKSKETQTADELAPSCRS